MEHTTVMLMLCVTIPGDPTTVRAKMGFTEMAIIALVTSTCNFFFFQTVLSVCAFSKKFLTLTQKFLKNELCLSFKGGVM